MQICDILVFFSLQFIFFFNIIVCCRGGEHVTLEPHRALSFVLIVAKRAPYHMGFGVSAV